MNQYPFPGQYPMNEVHSVSVGRTRPVIVGLAMVLWMVSAWIWPIGVLIRELLVIGDPSLGTPWENFELVLVMFGLGVLAIAQTWLAGLMRGGNWYARLTLAFAGVLLETVAVIELVGALDLGPDYSGAALALYWITLILRVIIAPVPFVLGFLPSVNAYLGTAP